MAWTTARRAASVSSEFADIPAMFAAASHIGLQLSASLQTSDHEIGIGQAGRNRRFATAWARRKARRAKLWWIARF